MAATLFISAPVTAQQLPVWEVGLGGIFLSIPTYRGSDERAAYLLPLPYVVYRGENLKVDREGVRGGLLHSERLRLDISLGAGPPAKNKDGSRVGMSELDPTFEIGPALEVKLGDTEATPWSIVLPWRAVVATDFRHAESLGWVFSPYLRYQVQYLPGNDWDFDISLGPLYAAERYHDYYYEVEPVFATTTRPVYNAPAGYSGSRVTLALSKRFKEFWIGMFVRYDDLSGAVFEDSPLVQKDHAFMVGGGIAWILGRSSETTDASY